MADTPADLSAPPEQEIRHELALRSRNTMTVYLALLVALGLVTPVAQEHPWAFAATFVAELPVLAYRWIVVRRMLSAEGNIDTRTFHHYRVGATVAALLWGIFSAAVVQQSGWRASTMIVALCSGGIAAGSVSAFASDVTLQRTHVLVLLLPMTVVGALRGDEGSGALATVLVLYAAYMLVLGKRQYGWFADAERDKRLLRQRTVELEEQRIATDRLKDEFISIVSHELRTPLTSLRGSLGLLAGGVLVSQPHKAKRMLDIAVGNVDRLVRIVNDILLFERLHAGMLSVEMTECDARGLLQQAADVVGGVAGDALHLEVETGPPLKVLADADRIVQVLTNLLGNAVKFSPPEGRITVGAEQSGEHVRFRVSDQGRGIPRDKIDHIFDWFFQVDSSDARDHAGTGLGLSICRGLVDQHGGRIWVESTPGTGTTFYFTLRCPS